MSSISFYSWWLSLSLCLSNISPCCPSIFSLQLPPVFMHFSLEEEKKKKNRETKYWNNKEANTNRMVSEERERVWGGWGKGGDMLVRGVGGGWERWSYVSEANPLPTLHNKWDGMTLASFHPFIPASAATSLPNCSVSTLICLFDLWQQTRASFWTPHTSKSCYVESLYNCISILYKYLV